MRKLLCALCLAAACTAPAAEPESSRTIDAKMYHLGTEGLPEWQEFEGRTPRGRRLDITFQAQENSEACTLFLRQSNVKVVWTVQLNAKKLGTLEGMDGDVIGAFEIPPKALRAGENTLSIVPPAATDDILIGNFRIDLRPRKTVLSEAKLNVRVTDSGTNAGLPCRITLATTDGALMPLSVLDDSSRPAAARTGVVYTRDGTATVGVPAGTYTLYATRGFEYSMATRQITIAAGQAQDVNLQITREVPTPGLIACDTHIHTRTFSGHGDATDDERMLTIAGEGIELAVSTEHNLHADYAPAQARTGLTNAFTTVVGNEITTKAGHFNAFPINSGSPVPDSKQTDWPVLLKSIRGTPGVQVITLNHPRDLHSNFTPFGPQNLNAVTGEHYRIADFSIDAVEVVTSAALQSDIELQFRDWFALLNYGFRTAGIGSSDSHDVTRFILGQGRTYARCDDSTPGKIDIDAACRSFREGRVAASMGLLCDVRVNERFAPGDVAAASGAEVKIVATVLGPSWVNADRVQLFANGELLREQSIEASSKIEKAKVTWTIPRPAQDTHLIVMATGPGVTAPCWAIPRPYQPTSKTWTPRVIGATNPVWLDADGDGVYTPPRALARKLLEKSKSDLPALLAALTPHDRAVAVQAASLCRAEKTDLKSDAVQNALQKAPEHIRRAFADVAATPEKSEPPPPAPPK
ncbi:MAG TPA: CehA/McbA family metallohydrolase [Planctomycetota bacterium]|nr:CehA/McbA family metallohydrolase [Planctomycetota bacterium]